jgi:hypothetical protein
MAFIESGLGFLGSPGFSGYPGFFGFLGFSRPAKQHGIRTRSLVFRVLL